MIKDSLLAAAPEAQETQGSQPSAPSVRRARRELFLISFGILFFELACIRWFGSTVVFLTFFTNIVLMACFLGITAGCLAARHRRNFTPAVIPLTLLALALSWIILVL